MPALTVAGMEISRFEGNLDHATDEVFSTMMGVHCEPVVDGAGLEREAISAVIGLAGAMSGSMVLHSGRQVAMRMAERLTGAAPKEVDATVRDAAGELCNMLAGAWKSLDPVMCSGCMLSTPTVIAGSSFEVFSQRAPIRIERSYQFESMTFTVTIFCEPQS
jgi:chemotaxis protein CheX